MISMRSMFAVGMLLKSTEVEVDVPPAARRPLINTSERTEPRLRRFARFNPDVATPEKVDWVRDAPKDGANCGNCVAKSAKFSIPRLPKVSRLTEMTGVVPRMSLRRIREPVISIRSADGAVAGAASGATTGETAGETAGAWAMAPPGKPSISKGPKAAEVASMRKVRRGKFFMGLADGAA